MRFSRQRLLNWLLLKLLVFRNQTATAVWEIFVAFEEFLDRRSLELKSVFSDLLGVVTFEIVIRAGLLLVKVISILGLEWRLEGLIQEGLPVKVLPPYVLLNLSRPVSAKSIARFPLEALVDEVGCLERPAFR